MAETVQYNAENYCTSTTTKCRQFQGASPLDHAKLCPHGSCLVGSSPLNRLALVIRPQTSILAMLLELRPFQIYDYIPLIIFD
jgi:hypothetical protein